MQTPHQSCAWVGAAIMIEPMRTAVVAGGGLGGLTAAVALHQRGWQVTVFERAPSLEPVGAAISVWPNALRALDTLGLGDAVRTHATLSGPGGIRSPDGRWLARLDLGGAIEARFGDPLVLVHRAELVDLLVGALPPGVVRTGVAVLGVHPGDADTRASVRTDEGAVPADLVVAADGIRSTLRRAVFPDVVGVRYTGCTAWRMVVPRPPGVTTGFETWGRHGCRFAVFPLGTDRLYCYATADAPAGVVAAEERAELVRLFGGWHAPIPAIVAGLAENQILHQDIEELASSLPTLHHERMALIGDAAHAMTPELGQGGCVAIEDAVVLAAVLAAALAAEPSIPAALRRFTATRRPRTTAIALRSRRAGRVHRLPYPLQTLVGRGMGLIPGAVLARGLGPVVDWRPPAGSEVTPATRRPGPSPRSQTHRQNRSCSDRFCR